LQLLPILQQDTLQHVPSERLRGKKEEEQGGEAAQAALQALLSMAFTGDQFNAGGEGIASRLVNRIRCFHYISGVLATQQSDPLCGKCKAYSNTVSAMGEGLSALEREYKEEFISLPGDIMQLLEEASARIRAIRPSEDVVGQKKAGNCKMPEGVCFVKSSKAILNQL
jgi:hypothetical protein